MDQRIKRILKKTIVNLFKLSAFVSGIFIFMLACIWLSLQATGDILFGIAAFFVPIIISSVWDLSKNQIEAELYKEERTIDALKREY